MNGFFFGDLMTGLQPLQYFHSYRISFNAEPPKHQLLISWSAVVDMSCSYWWLSRPTCFRPSSSLTSFDYRRSLWFGSTPPHQATVFGPGARRRLAHYSPFFRLSGDLDYFLKLSDFRTSLSNVWIWSLYIWLILVSVDSFLFDV